MMKTLVQIIILFLVFSSVRAQSPMKVMTYNIRLDLESDGENAWDKRKENFADILRSDDADVIGVQEALRHQIDDIVRAVPRYAWCGVGRDDGHNAGEFMAILYRKDRFSLLHTSTFWCSPTPATPSLGWDAAYRRVVTWGKFRDQKNGRDFFLFNTHLDNEGRKARRESARQLLDSIHVVAGNFPVIITGDFNSTPDDEPYRIVTKPVLHGQFFDSRHMSANRPYGPSGTFNGFGARTDSLALIDYIFVQKGMRVLTHGTVSKAFNGMFPSDHFPVVAEIVLE